MKKLFKILLGLIVFAFISFGAVYLIFNEEKPAGKIGVEAEQLATKMLTALNHDQYLKTDTLEWSFVGRHFYKWSKSSNTVEVKWNRNTVVLVTDDLSKSSVLEPKGLDESKQMNLINEANSFFNNDSFWLVAPHKIRDKGTERQLVMYEGRECLMVTFKSGGETPGDSYLWILDDTGRPESFKMWVGIIPIGGIEASWSDWVKTESGTLLPTKHKVVFATIELGEVKGY